MIYHANSSVHSFTSSSLVSSYAKKVGWLKFYGKITIFRGMVSLWTGWLYWITIGRITTKKLILTIKKMILTIILKE